MHRSMPASAPGRALSAREMGMPPAHMGPMAQQAGHRPVQRMPAGPHQSGEWQNNFTDTVPNMEAMASGVAERVRRIIPPSTGGEPPPPPAPSPSPHTVRRNATRTRSGPIQTPRRVTGSFSTPPRAPSISRIRRPLDEEELRRPAITRNSGSRQVGEDPLGPDFFDTGCIDASCDDSIEIEASSVPAWLQVRRR